MHETHCYTELEFIVAELETVQKLIEITTENLFAKNTGDLSPWAMRYNAPLDVSLDILKKNTKQIEQVFNALWEADNKEKKEGEAA